MTIASGTPDRLADLSLDKHLAKLVNIDFRTALIERKVTVPLTGASAPEILKISTDAAEISWIRGSGSANVVFISEKKSTIPHPQSGVTYNANPVYKKGSRIDKCGWYCVYNGHAAEIKISGLFHGTQYQIVIIDYNGIPGYEQYLFDSSDMCMLIFTTASEPGKDSQVIDFDLPAHLTAGVSPFLLNATASSDLRVVYSSSDTAVATIKGDSLFIIGPGTTCITASQAGNNSIAAAADITCILKVSAGKADGKK